MSVIIETLFLFIYLTILFYFKFPDITNNNYLFHKMIIMIMTFVFKFVIELYKKIKNEEKVDPIVILNESVNYSLYCIIGYSVYIDLMYIKIPYENIYIDINNDIQRFFISSFVTSLCVAFIGGVKNTLSNTNK